MKLDTNSLAHTQWECKYHTYFLNIHWWHFGKGCSAGNIHFFIHFW